MAKLFLTLGPWNPPYLPKLKRKMQKLKCKEVTFELFAKILLFNFSPNFYLMTLLFRTWRRRDDDNGIFKHFATFSICKLYLLCLSQNWKGGTTRLGGPLWMTPHTGIPGENDNYDSRLRELECSLPRHKVPCITTLVTTLLGVPIFTSYQ